MCFQFGRICIKSENSGHMVNCIFNLWMLQKLLHSLVVFHTSSLIKKVIQVFYPNLIVLFLGVRYKNSLHSLNTGHLSNIYFENISSYYVGYFFYFSDSVFWCTTAFCLFIFIYLHSVDLSSLLVRVSCIRVLTKCKVIEIYFYVFF